MATTRPNSPHTNTGDRARPTEGFPIELEDFTRMVGAFTDQEYLAAIDALQSTITDVLQEAAREASAAPDASQPDSFSSEPQPAFVPDVSTEPMTQAAQAPLTESLPTALSEQAPDLSHTVRDSGYPADTPIAASGGMVDSRQGVENAPVDPAYSAAAMDAEQAVAPPPAEGMVAAPPAETNSSWLEDFLDEAEEALAEQDIAADAQQASRPDIFVDDTVSVDRPDSVDPVSGAVSPDALTVSGLSEPPVDPLPAPPPPAAFDAPPESPVLDVPTVTGDAPVAHDPPVDVPQETAPSAAFEVPGHPQEIADRPVADPIAETAEVDPTPDAGPPGLFEPPMMEDPAIAAEPPLVEEVAVDTTPAADGALDGPEREGGLATVLEPSAASNPADAMAVMAEQPPVQETPGQSKVPERTVGLPGSVDGVLDAAADKEILTAADPGADAFILDESDSPFVATAQSPAPDHASASEASEYGTAPFDALPAEAAAAEESQTFTIDSSVDGIGNPTDDLAGLDGLPGGAAGKLTDTIPPQDFAVPAGDDGWAVTLTSGPQIGDSVTPVPSVQSSEDNAMPAEGQQPLRDGKAATLDPDREQDQKEE